MAYINDYAISSCGIFSIEEIGAPIRVIKAIYLELTEELPYVLPVPAFYVFSDVIGTKNKQSPGQKLAKFIKKNFPNSNIARSCVRKKSKQRKSYSYLDMGAAAQSGINS